MQTIDFTVMFSAEVPDDIDIQSLFLNIPIKKVEIFQNASEVNKTPMKQLPIGSYTIWNYETTNVEINP